MLRSGWDWLTLVSLIAFIVLLVVNMQRYDFLPWAVIAPGEGLLVQDAMPIKDELAQSFVTGDLAYVEKALGPPRTPVHLVRLLYTLETPRTQIVDEERGVFTISLCREPADYAYRGQLGHEVGHLLNAYLYDPYIEGLNTVLSERYCKREDMDWSGWRRYLADNSDPAQRFYGSTYRMMKEVSTAAGPEYIRTLLRFVVPTKRYKDVMHIEINDWLKTMPLEKRKRVSACIRRFQSEVLSSMPDDGFYQFSVPLESDK